MIKKNSLDCVKKSNVTSIMRRGNLSFETTINYYI